MVLTALFHQSSRVGSERVGGREGEQESKLTRPKSVFWNVIT